MIYYAQVITSKRGLLMLKEMDYIYAVYEEKSFSRAAKKLFVSQPALSNMVKKAEKEIGAPIFDRSTIPLTVTPAGEYYDRPLSPTLSEYHHTP